MNHDIAHCNGEGCMLRESCLRYHAHLEYQADEKLRAVVSAPYCEAEECRLTGNKLYSKTTDLRTLKDIENERKR